jgi:hypothetical protein
MLSFSLELALKALRRPSHLSLSGVRRGARDSRQHLLRLTTARGVCQCTRLRLIYLTCLIPSITPQLSV